MFTERNLKSEIFSERIEMEKRVEWKLKNIGCS